MGERIDILFISTVRCSILYVLCFKHLFKTKPIPIPAVSGKRCHKGGDLLRFVPNIKMELKLNFIVTLILWGKCG